MLLEKLFYYGVKGTPLKLLASYSDSRFQCTKIGDTKSFFHVTCGVPQGSVVEPLLFLIYILMTLLKPLTLILFYMLMISISILWWKTTKS